MYVNPPGGSLHAALAIYDTMQTSAPTCRRSATWMAMVRRLADPRGGAEGKWLTLPKACILIHQPSQGFQGQSSDIEIHAREILELRRVTEEIYARHTGQPIEQVHDDMERDRFFGAEEAGLRPSWTGSSRRASCGRSRSGFAAALGS